MLILKRFVASSSEDPIHISKPTNPADPHSVGSITPWSPVCTWPATTGFLTTTTIAV